MERKEIVKIEFSYTDEYGQESTVKQTLSSELLVDTDTLELLTEQFKLFLLASGHSKENVDKIQIIE